MLLQKPLKIKRPSQIRLTRSSSRRKRAFGLIFWISDYRRCCCYGVCDVAVEQEKREQPYPDGFPNMAVLFCCTPVWQLPCVSIISILFYWKLPDEDFFFIRKSPPPNPLSKRISRYHNQRTATSRHVDIAAKASCLRQAVSRRQRSSEVRVGEAGKPPALCHYLDDDFFASQNVLCNDLMYKQTAVRRFVCICAAGPFVKFPQFLHFPRTDFTFDTLT